MDKVNFVPGFTPDKPDFDKLQESLESGLENVAASIAGMGVKTGFDATITGSQVSVSAGIGFDGLGRILQKDEALTADLGTLARPGAGKYRWVTIALRYKITEDGQVIDINNQPCPAQYLDDVEIEIIDPGVNDTSENITKPDFTEYQVPILDLRLDETSTWENLLAEESRKPQLLSMSEMAVEQVAVKSYVDGMFPVGSDYLQLPGGLTPSQRNYPGTWENVSSEDAGDFYRIEGGKSLAYGGGEQGHAFQGHHFYGSTDGANSQMSNQRLGLGSTNQSGNHGYGGRSLGDPISDGANGPPQTDSETRPVNRTIRKWRRTA